MPNSYSTPDLTKEPHRRFYPTQETQSQTQPRIPSAPAPSVSMQPQLSKQYSVSRKKRDDAAYLAHRHPILLQRLYNAVDSFLSAYPKQEFIYDTYPDYLSLHLMRDRILRESPSLTKDFLQAGCPIE